VAGVRPARVRTARSGDTLDPLRPLRCAGARRATRPVVRCTRRRHGLHGARARRARRGRLAREPDAHVGRVALDRPGRSGLARRRGPPLPRADRRLARREPARLAVDRGDRHRPPLRVLPVAGRAPRAGPVHLLPAARRLPDRGLAGGSVLVPSNPTRGSATTRTWRDRRTLRRRTRARRPRTRGRVADRRVARGRRPGARRASDAPGGVRVRCPLLARLRLHPRRLVFLAETLGDLATRREVEVWRGDVVATLGTASGTADAASARPLATTFAPVPGWRRRAALLPVVEHHPWPWLRRPDGGRLSSFSSWRGGASKGRRPR
jgi:hypothetical protein